MVYMGSEGNAPRILNLGTRRTGIDVSNQGVSVLTGYSYRVTVTFSVRWAILQLPSYVL
jgi:hypothetical protein